MLIGTLGASFLLNLFIAERVIRIDEVALKGRKVLQSRP